jgi:hypothetical protein
MKEDGRIGGDVIPDYEFEEELAASGTGVN